jgi:hypothetical protein
MKNTTTFITKDGVSDADLIAAARDMYEAATRVVAEGAWHGPENISLSALYALNSALAKARGRA